MYWLQSVELAEDGFLGTFFTLHKDVERAYIDSREAFSPRPSTYRTITAELDLTSWNLVSAATYFPALTEEEAARTPHRVYQFHCAGVSVLVPAYVLMRAFHLSGYRKSLIFSPGDLQEYGFLDEIGEIFVFSRQNAREMPPSPSEGQLLRYLLAYPSGREFWNSVYRNLSTGVIDAQLPKAILTAEARGHIRGAHFCVETLAIQTIAATEKAEGQHPVVPKVFQFPHKNLSSRWRPIPCAEFLSPEITDSEWRELRSLLRDFDEDDVSVDTMRWCIESILYKEISGAAWPKLLVTWEIPFVLSHYEAWVKSGVWTDIRKKLAEMRSAELKSSPHVFAPVEPRKS